MCLLYTKLDEIGNNLLLAATCTIYRHHMYCITMQQQSGTVGGNTQRYVPAGK